MESITRFTQAVARSPALSGMLVATIGSLIWVAFESAATAMGAPSQQPVVDGVFVLLLSIQTGYFLAAIPLIRTAGLECANELRPLLEISDPDCVTLVERLCGTAMPALSWTASLAAIITFVMQEVQFSRFSQWFSQPDAALGEFWLVLVAWVTWTLAVSTLWMVVRDVSAIHRLGRDYVAVDLMRIDQLAVFSHYGLRLAGYIVILMCLWAIGLALATSYVSFSWAENSTYTGLGMGAFYVSMSVSVFVLPQLGIRQRIRSEKGRVYSLLTQMLPQADHTLVEAGANPERLSALLNSRSQIQALPEWPAGQHTHIRLALYLMVPLLSWSAAALVEETISRLLG